MKLSDVINAGVQTSSGAHVGVVADVRCTMSGPPLGSLAALQVSALLVSRRRPATLLGYERGHTQGPALLRWLVGLLGGGTVTVPWEDILTLDPERRLVVIRGDRLR